MLKLELEPPDLLTSETVGVIDAEFAPPLTGAPFIESDPVGTAPGAANGALPASKVEGVSEGASIAASCATVYAETGMPLSETEADGHETV